MPERRRLAADASSLSERLAGDYVPASRPEDEKARLVRLERWRALAAGGDDGRYRQRLSWDGVTEESARALLGRVDLRPSLSPPAWTETAVELIRHAELEGPPGSLPTFLDPSAPIPFEEVLAPFVSWAIPRLACRVGQGSELLERGPATSLERHLLRSVAGLAGPCLSRAFSAYRAARRPALATFLAATRGDRSRTLYESFIADQRRGGMRELFREYPVLARHLATVVDQWVDSSVELEGRLRRDRAALEESFGGGAPLGPLVDLGLGLSDRHRGGRSVVGLVFASGARIVYKPRTVGLEALWHELLRWAEARGAPISLRSCATLARDGYGWMEAATAEPCADEDSERRYFTRAGALLALTDALGASDLHAENLIACGEHPVLVDLETLLQPGSLWGNGLDLLDIGLLPFAARIVGDSRVDLTALGYLDGESVAGRATEWLDPNTDAMQLVPVTAKLGPLPGQLVRSGEPVRVWKHADALSSGFREMRRWLTEHAEDLLAVNGPLSAIGSQQVRVIFRPTMVYAAVLQRSLDPERLRDGADWSLELEALVRPALQWPLEQRGSELFRAERRELERLDVPYFQLHADTDVLRSEEGSILSTRGNSALARAVARLRSLGKKRMETSERLIGAAVATAGRRARTRSRRAETDASGSDEDGLAPPRRESLPSAASRLPLGTGPSMSPFCIGFVEDPATVAAAVDAGLNAFFVSVDLHWPIYRHTVEGLRRLLRGRPSLRADIIVAAVSYVQNPGFTLAAFGELLAAAPELETLDVLVAGGCGVSRPFSRETLEEIRAILGANGRRPALGASFHDRTMALGVALEKDVDLVFLRYNPTHPGARHDTLPLMPELPERPLVYAFLTTFGSEAKGEVSETLAGGWRPRRQDYYRFALTRQQIDGLLFAPRRPEDIAPLLSAMEEGPLSCEEEESMLSAARRRRDPT